MNVLWSVYWFAQILLEAAQTAEIRCEGEAVNALYCISIFKS